MIYARSIVWEFTPHFLSPVYKFIKSWISISLWSDTELFVEIRLLFSELSSEKEPNSILWLRSFLFRYLFYLLLFPSSSFTFSYLGKINIPKEEITPKIPTLMKNISALMYPSLDCYPSSTNVPDIKGKKHNATLSIIWIIPNAVPKIFFFIIIETLESTQFA